MSDHAFIVVGLGYGDEGKGSVTDWLCREYEVDLVVRYNGGAQAAHNVTLPDGRSHTFAQFGSGTFVPGVKTYLSSYMMVNPMTMFTENDHLKVLGIDDAFERLSIHANALVTTPFQVVMNRLRELHRGSERHGSCGLGIGETRADAQVGRIITAMDLIGDLASLRHKLKVMQQVKLEEAKALDMLDHPEASTLTSVYELDYVMDSFTILGEMAKISLDVTTKGTMVFEGAQGVLLDEVYGEEPHRTWSTTTTENATKMLRNFDGEITKIGVTRSYATRHGAGPLATEDGDLTLTLPEEHNIDNPWQGAFRCGWLNFDELRYALACIHGVDYLAVTCLDRFNHDCVQMVEGELGTPVGIKSFGPTHEDKVREGVKAC